MEIYFIKDGVKTLINNDYVMSMSQSGSLFDSQFKLGSTLSRCLKLEIDKLAFPSGFDFDNIEVLVPIYSDYVLATESGEILTTTDEYLINVGKYLDQDIDYIMRVDDYSLENDRKYAITCYDEMIYLNKDLDYDYKSYKTVLEILNGICTNHGLALATTDLYGSDMQVRWSLDCTERDFVSYVAEINGGYAYVKDNNLYIIPFDSNPKQTIDVEDTSGYEIGNKHIVDRVYLEMASASYYYPSTTENETCYLNSDNPLFVDVVDGSYTIQKTVEHIANVLGGLTFYNLKIDRCYIKQDINTGDFIALQIGDTLYPTIVQLDTTFSYAWRGGYELSLDTAEQVEETQVTGTVREQLKRLKITVDRDLNTITQEVSSITSDVGALKEDTTTLKQSTSDLTLRVSSTEKAISDEDTKITEKTKYFIAYDEGLAVSENAKVVDEKTLPTGNHVLITNNSFEVKQDDTIVASMSENTFQTSNWTMRQYDNNNIFNIFKGGK